VRSESSVLPIPPIVMISDDLGSNPSAVHEVIANRVAALVASVFGGMLGVLPSGRLPFEQVRRQPSSPALGKK